MEELRVNVTGLDFDQCTGLIQLIEEYGMDIGASVTWSRDDDERLNYVAVHKAQVKE